MRNNKGFSLVELIVVIAIMAILAAVAIPTFAGFITKANESTDVGFMNDLEYAIELAHARETDTSIKSIEVTLGSDGKTISTIEYVMTDGTNDKTYTIDKDDTDDVSAVVDWSYGFKAAKTVESNQNWNAAIWSIEGN